MVNWIGLVRFNFTKNRIILSIIKIVYRINVVLRELVKTKREIYAKL